MNGLCVCVSGKSIRNHIVQRKKELHALCLSLRHQILGQVDLVNFAERSTNFAAHRGKECISHTAADDDGVSFFEKVLNNTDLVRYFRTAKDRDERTCRLCQGLAHEIQLLLNQVAGSRRQIIRQARRRSMRAVRRSKSVIDVQIRHRSQFGCKSRIILCLFLMKTNILQHQDLAVLQSGGLRLRILADDISSQNDRLAEKLRQTIRRRLHRKSCLRSVLRATQVRNQDDLRIVVHQVGNCGKSSLDALIIRNRACLLVKRYVKINTYNYPLPGNLEVFDILLLDHCHNVHTPYILSPQKASGDISHAEALERLQNQALILYLYYLEGSMKKYIRERIMWLERDKGIK